MPDSKFTISIADLHCLNALPTKVIPSPETLPTNLPERLHLFFNVGFVQGGELHLVLSNASAQTLLIALGAALNFKLVTVPPKQPNVRDTQPIPEYVSRESLVQDPNRYINHLFEGREGGSVLFCRHCGQGPEVHILPSDKFLSSDETNCPKEPFRSSSKPPSGEASQTEPVDSGEPL